MRIDFISDVVCPWCAIGLLSLEAAAARIPGLVLALHFQPFELNPGMPPEGEDIDEHLARKYGAPPAQLAATREALRQRGAELGFEFRPGARSRIVNTRTAHRLLHLAGEAGPGAQRALKGALLAAYFTGGQDVSRPEVLRPHALAAGLAADAVDALLAGNRFDAEVQALEDGWRAQGIQAVPAVVIDRRLLVSGGQAVEVFERALRQALAT